MTKYFVIAIVILGLMLTGSAAQAETCNFDVSSGNWTDGGNWSCGYEPTADDLAVILSGNTCTMDDAAGEADSLTVESTATLNVPANKKLTLNSSTASTTITGTVNLQGSGSELAFELNDQTIHGLLGKIVGHNSGAKITVALSTTLTTESCIEGALKITGDGNFTNGGLVHANTSGPLEVSTLFIDDDNSTGGFWRVTTSSSAVLHLAAQDASFQTLGGSFRIETGTLTVDAPGFVTTGNMTMTGGAIEVAANAMALFKW